MKTDFQHIFQLAQQQNRYAQQYIFELYSGKLLFVASSYVGNTYDAEDILMQAFYKAFTKIEMCKNHQAFPAWLRKIVVNEAISHTRKKQNILYLDSEYLENQSNESEDDILNDDVEIDIQVLMNAMPTGYRIIFNLVVFEEKKHKEIAELLNISEGTSKSQYSKAKKFLVDFISQQKQKQNAEKS